MRAIEIIARHPRWGGVVVLLCAALAAAMAAYWSVGARERERQSRLEISLQRHALKAMSLTVDGNLMGAISMLGLVSPEIKREGVGQAAANTPEALALLGSVAKAFDAQAVFVVSQQGVVASSWDDNGNRSTGLQVAFRPYFNTAMQGHNNVYAAISLSRDERTLYFAAPVYPGLARGGAPVGAVVARTGIDRIDRLLAAMPGTALLLSPQGLVFASNRAEWRGQLAVPATPALVAQLRATRQFGNLFERHTPVTLPFAAGTGITSVDGRRHAMASTAVAWNDPAGEWRLVLLEDLTHATVPGRTVRDGAVAGALTLLIGLLLLRMLRARLTQRQASCQLEQIAQEQAARAERKMQLAELALRMQQADGAAAVVSVFLDDCHRLLGALQGVVYCVDGSGSQLCLAGAYAGMQPVRRIAIGHGLLGQCARERQLRLLDVNDDSPWQIHSGLGQTAPAALLLVPVLLQARLLGVVELALPQRPDGALLEQVTAMAELLAINLGFSRRAAAWEVPSEEDVCDVC